MQCELCSERKRRRRRVRGTPVTAHNLIFMLVCGGGAPHPASASASASAGVPHPPNASASGPHPVSDV